VIYHSLLLVRVCEHIPVYLRDFKLTLLKFLLLLESHLSCWGPRCQWL